MTYGYAFSKLNRKTNPFWKDLDWYVLLDGEPEGIIDQLRAMGWGYV